MLAVWLSLLWTCDGRTEEVVIPVPAGPEAEQRLAKPRAEQRRQWLERNAGAAFRERAKGQPWEAEGTRFVAEALARWQPRSDYETDADLAEQGRHLREQLGCSDPLVVFLTARLQAQSGYVGFWHAHGMHDSQGFYRSSYQQAAAESDKALKDLEKLQTSGGFLSIASRQVADWKVGLSDTWAIDAEHKRRWRWLRAALFDGSYLLPGPEEDLLVEDFFGQEGQVNVRLLNKEMRDAFDQAPLSEWARLITLALCDHKADIDRHDKGGPYPDWSPALAACEEAWKLHPNNREIASMGYSFVRKAKQSATSREEWFKRAVQAQFDHFTPYSDAITYRRPGWGGDDEEVSAFGRACVATKRFDTAVPLYLMSALRTVCVVKDWRPICRTEANGEALLALGRGLLAEPSRKEQEPIWRSLAAVWAFLGGRDQEASEMLAALPEGKLHPAAEYELRYFRSSLAAMKEEIALRLSPAIDLYEEGQEQRDADDLDGARTAFLAALQRLPTGHAARPLVEAELALTQWEIESYKGEWMKVPLDLRLWWTVNGRWTNGEGGNLILEGQEDCARALFRGRARTLCKLSHSKSSSSLQAGSIYLYKNEGR